MNAEIIKDPDYRILYPNTKLVKSIYEWVEAAVFSLLCVTLIFTFLMRIVGVDGSSMNNTLYDSERLIISRAFYKPKRGDIIIINRYTEEPLVKRIIAVGGDRLEIDDETHQILLNGSVLYENYTLGVTWREGFPTGEQVVPQDSVFVMGDNRENSKDSRAMDEVGYVDVEDIMGKAVFRFFPLSRAGGLY
ncbi:MAG: signal peptidase I [Oscillospiraceae bacterium]|nr:signal peptidase I [Oscillospiraceae bacterium]MDD4413545.1 signal peptidase I [Oscillospiraceae bacterium]